MLKKIMSRTAAPFMTKPAEPIWKGPFGTFFRPVSRFGAMARTYEVEVRIMNEPARSVKAVLLPSEIAPRPREITTQRSVAGIGQLRLSLTLENK